MLPADIVALYRDLEANGVRVWLMGGWGVDALLGRQTRPHHDVDLLVEVAGLERLRARLDELGFDFKYLWDDECRGEGLVGGQRVRCLSREEQRRAHTGYDLPPQHVRDLRLLAADG